MADDLLPSTVSTGGVDPAESARAGRLTDASLGRLAAALAPLAAMNTAAGARSLFRDPRELVTHGAPPEETPLERGCDSGVIREARRVWQRWLVLPAEIRATLLWVAERSGAVVQVGAWSLAIGEALGPADARELAVTSAERAEVAERLKGRLQKDARGGLTREQAQELDRVTQREARARAAHKLAAGRLRAWGEGALEAAVVAWNDNRYDAA